MTLLAYLPVWRAGYIWDDDIYVTQNSLLTASHGLWRFWFSLDSPSQYFPLTYSTFYVEHLLWGFQPAGYHVVNVLLHAANAVLVWRLLLRLRLPGAWLAGALFALHPVQVESVAWITERKNVLMGFFFLLTLLAWVRFVEPGAKRRWRWYGLALLFYGLALAAKTTACTLPAALLLVLWLRKEPIGWRRWAQAAPFAGMGAVMGLVTVWWERFHIGTEGAAFGIGPLERVLIAGRALWFYAGKLLWPAHLTFSYPRWRISASDPWAYGWLAALAAAGWVLWRTRRWMGRGGIAAAVFFAVTLSPVLGFIMLYTFRFTFVADHYQYVACLGPLALAAAGMERGLSRLTQHHPLLKTAGWVMLLAILGGLTWNQCREYAGAETLWEATLEKNPSSWLAHNDLGALLLDQNKPQEAALHFKAALALNPDYGEAHDNLAHVLRETGDAAGAIAEYRKAVFLRPNYEPARINLGILLAQKGELAEAIAQFRKALEIQPDDGEAFENLGIAQMQNGEASEAVAPFRKALALRPDLPQAMRNLGRALLLAGEYDEAMACFQKTVALPADPVESWYSMGKESAAKGQFPEAIACYRQSTALRPGFADGWAGLGMVCFNSGRLKEAAQSWQKSLELNPVQPQILNSLASLLATAADDSLRDGPKAVALAEGANQLTGGANPVILRTLGAAYAEAGRFGDALAAARKALAQAEAMRQNQLAGALQEEIKLYEAGHPARGATPLKAVEK
jgi:tetratricopeptide (TPR) repeat protein